ncbi:hypothetical protein AGDE_07012 [Angomonas deanei]|uniref:Alpha/beta hydrolase fold/Alpha/beta hydrolase family, putative n=1 Tax=Angomonas deanei TaxID=59799 RepID=S9WJZ1_9TRYP|nr:hypothetical protein AGDE_08710 [Angomonas deanei]EPY36240.1 hypothetical protein AGDE_07012 [Angomonas deanei]CAD2214656.1 alpha/beta hydrolase fold/Alpha/beta hydrolase family, putative [Angomonas deanei]|eukprot:EPY32403.1 hypothetical protein AGDE_08710 [Angomonas deanei]
MYSGHIHTILGGARLPKRVEYERELLTAKSDGNPICMDWLKVKEGDPVKGVILLIPGLGNYGQTNYIQRFVRLSVRRGYHCCVLTPRGMGSAPLTTPNITCVTFTSDIRQALREVFSADAVVSRFGRSLPVIGVGYSCGANTLIMSVAQEFDDFDKNAAVYGGKFPLIGVISMTAPNEMAYSASMLRTRMGNLLYKRPIMTALRKYLRKHKKMFESARDGLTEEEVSKLPLIHRNFDECFKKLKIPRDIDEHVVAAHFKYKDEFVYYADGYAPKYVRRVRIPILNISTQDDPIAGYLVNVDDWTEVCNENDNAVYVEFPTGGHFGFVQNPLKEFSQIFGVLESFPIDAVDSLVSS